MTKGVLQCKANGEFTFALKGVYAKVSVLWNFEAPEGAGDTLLADARHARVADHRAGRGELQAGAVCRAAARRESRRKRSRPR